MERRKFLAGVLSLPIVAAIGERFMPKAEASEPVEIATITFKEDLLRRSVGTNFFVTEQWQRYSWTQGDYVWSMYAKAIPTESPVLIQHFCSPEMFNIEKSAIQYTTEAWHLITWSPMCEYMPGIKPYIHAHASLDRALEQADMHRPLMFTMPDSMSLVFTSRQLTANLRQLDSSPFYKAWYAEEVL